MKELEDSTLVKQILEGHEKSFEILVDRYQKVIYNLALRMLNDVQDAEDIAQTVFIKAYQNLSTFDFKYKFFNWIYRMAINESLNLGKQRKRLEGLEVDYASENNSPEKNYENLELSNQVGSALMCIDPEYRILIILKHLQELSYSEISYILEMSEKKVKSRLFTARHLLKDVMVKQGIKK